MGRLQGLVSSGSETEVGESTDSEFDTEEASDFETDAKDDRNVVHDIPEDVQNIFYVPPARKLVFSLQLRVTQCCPLRYREM